MTGIEYFTGLKELYCYSNQLSSLDVSSQNMDGLFIYSGEKPLTTLKVNVAQKDIVAIKNVKDIRGASVTISTYTNNSTEAPMSANYTPQ